MILHWRSIAKALPDNGKRSTWPYSRHLGHLAVTGQCKKYLFRIAGFFYPGGSAIFRRRTEQLNELLLSFPKGIYCSPLHGHHAQRPPDGSQAARPVVT